MPMMTPQAACQGDYAEDPCGGRFRNPWWSQQAGRTLVVFILEAAEIGERNESVSVDVTVLIRSDAREPVGGQNIIVENVDVAVIVEVRELAEVG